MKRSTGLFRQSLPRCIPSCLDRCAVVVASLAALVAVGPRAPGTAEDERRSAEGPRPESGGYLPGGRAAFLGRPAASALSEPQRRARLARRRRRDRLRSLLHRLGRSMSLFAFLAEARRLAPGRAGLRRFADHAAACSGGICAKCSRALACCRSIGECAGALALPAAAFPVLGPFTHDRAVDEAAWSVGRSSTLSEYWKARGPAAAVKHYPLMRRRCQASRRPGQLPATGTFRPGNSDTRSPGVLAVRRWVR